MATQHPDNATIPSWASGEVMDDRDELLEAYYCYNDLGCMELMWDYEGKDTDIMVVRKLLHSFPEFFREKVLGRDIFLTYRIPNPDYEVAERKLILETLISLARQHDAASVFYGEGAHPPVFEVILPFTSNHVQVIRLYELYNTLTHKLSERSVDFTGLKIRDWLGPIIPESINVIPLFEDEEALIKSDRIIARLIELYSPRSFRVFLARSDPALSNGYLAATILNVVALQRLMRLSEETGTEIHPIIGVGSLPFRGGLSNQSLDAFLETYRGVSTVTIQSAIKYDYPIQEAKSLVDALNNRLPYRGAREIEEERLLKIAAQLGGGYASSLAEVAGFIEPLAALVPPRRQRRPHIGTFGYGRRVEGKYLPRAIPFTASLYSIGTPPEFMGLRSLSTLSGDDLDDILSSIPSLRQDLGRSASYVSWRAIDLLLSPEFTGRTGMSPLRDFLQHYIQDLRAAEERLGIRIGPKSTSERLHENAVNDFILYFMEGDLSSASSRLVEAAKIRRALG